MALIVRPSSLRNATARPAADAGGTRTARAANRPTPNFQLPTPKLCGESSKSEHIEVFADALGEADKQRVADERMSDRDLVQVRQAAENHEVVEIEIVSRVHAEPERMRQLRGA